jgi:hypothetical protein
MAYLKKLRSNNGQKPPSLHINVDGTARLEKLFWFGLFHMLSEKYMEMTLMLEEKTLLLILHCFLQRNSVVDLVQCC